MAEEAPSGEQVPVTHIVVTVHAIRTYGEWQGRLEELVAERLRDSPPAARPLFCHYRYGFFSLLAFYFAPTRWLQVRRFRTDLERLIGRYPAVERIDIFAHSFGTYLASWALGAKPRSKTLPRVANLVLAGSVLRRTHPWLDWIDRRVSRVVNECGDLDHVLLLNQLVVPFAGAGGLLGFQTFETRDLVQRYFQIGHSGYFEPRGGDANWFLSRYWVPIICGPPGAPLEPAREVKPLTALRGVRLFMLNSSTVLKLTLAGAMVAAAFAYILGLYRATEEQRQLAVARLAASNSAKLARMVNDPTHDLSVAALLAVEALRRLPEAEANAFLLQNALRLAPTIANLRAIETIALSEDERRLAVAWRSTIIVVPTEAAPASQQIALSLQASEKVSRLRFVANDQFLAAVSDGGLTIFRLADRRPVLTHRGMVQAFAHSPSGMSVAIAGSEGKVATAALGADASVLKDVPISQAVALAYASETLLVAASGNAIHAFDGATGRVTQVDTVRKARGVRLGPDRRQVVALLAPEAPSARASDIAVFRLSNDRLEATNLARSVVTAFDITADSRVVFGDESGIVDLLRAEGNEEAGNNCFLHEIQEDVRVNGRPIEDPTPPVPSSVVRSPNEDFGHRNEPISGAAAVPARPRDRTLRASRPPRRTGHGGAVRGWREARSRSRRRWFAHLGRHIQRGCRGPRTNWLGEHDRGRAPVQQRLFYPGRSRESDQP